MAKTNTVLIKLVSSADTGFYYVTKKNPRTKTNKLELKKFDPVAGCRRAHAPRSMSAPGPTCVVCVRGAGPTPASI